MITIQKDNKLLNVTRGAYNSVYEPSGWYEVDNYTHDNEAPYNVDFEGLGEQSDNHIDINETEDEKKRRKEALQEIPISSMSQKELKELASLVGVSIKNKSKSEVQEEVIKVLNMGA